MKRTITIKPVGARAAAAVFSLLLVFSGQARCQETGALELPDLTAAMDKVASLLQVVRFSYKVDFPAKGGGGDFYTHDLAFEAGTKKFVDTYDRYADPERKVWRNRYVAAWDGESHYSWSRKIDLKKKSFGLLNDEPLDPGSVVLDSKPAFGPVEFLLDIMKPLPERIDPAQATQSIVPSSEPSLPGSMMQLKGKSWSASFHLQSGWLIHKDRSIGPSPGGYAESYDVADFVSVGVPPMYFPTKITRTFHSGEKSQTTVIRIDRPSIQINTMAGLPRLFLPPDTNIQDKITGTSRVVRDDKTDDPLEARLRFLLQQADLKMKSAKPASPQ